jgi:putative acyl-CoA dehydrogenase
MRQALAQALHHATHRRAFGKALIDQPLMRNVLADLALELEASVALALRVARSFDEAARGGAQAAAFSRIATAVAKYFLNKRAPGHVAECLESLGGAGYVEESVLPRLYREAPLNGIWEGSGNVICLDVLRAMSREPECLDALFAEVADVCAQEPRVAAAAARVRSELAHGEGLEARARRLTEALALLLEAALLVRHAPAAVADAFLQTRLEGGARSAYGTLPDGVDVARLLERAWPPVG